MNHVDRQQLDRLLDGDLPPEERDAVLKSLGTDPDAIAYLADRAILVTDLRRSLKRRQLQREAMISALAETGDSARSKSLPISHLRLPALAWVGVAISLLLAMGVFLFHYRSAGRGEVIAEIVASQAAMPATDWPLGRRVAIRHFELASGRVVLRLANGVLIDLAGPLRAQFVSGGELRLLHGQATVDVGGHGKGFTIDTVNARVVDMGTRFGVAVGPSNETDVVVFEGKVEVFDPVKQTASQQPKITLTEGDAIRVDASRKPRRTRMIALGPDARSLGNESPSDTVADVKDNVVQEDFRGYYGLLPHGMGEGARLYTTGHTHAWHAMAEAPFPGELRGADVICTFSDDRQETDLEITLMIARPCELYVLPDARAPVPEWLQRDFTDTGLRLRSGPWWASRGISTSPQAKNADGTILIEHAVWKKRISTPGPVVLGPPRAARQNANLVMYGIAVKALPSIP
jgi:anti-sigma factor RsiW